MKKTNLITNLCMLVLTLASLTFGVYSAIKASFTASGTITFNAYNLDVLVHGEIIGAIDNGSLVADYKKATVDAHGVDGYTISEDGTLPAWAMGNFAFDELNENNLITIKFTIVNYSKYPIEATATIADETALKEKMNITKTDMYYCYDADYDANGAFQRTNSGEIVLTFAPKSGAGAFNKDLNITIDVKPSNKTPNAESDFTFNAGAITGYSGTATEVIIPKKMGEPKVPVTSIGSYAFQYCDSLTTITIPEGVKSIGDNAFQYCSSLKTITIPASVTSIGSSAFYGCSSLKTITIPDSVTSIGSFAFNFCSSLTTITIPDSVTSIGVQAFQDCSSLTTITIPEGVKSIGDNAFQYCSKLTTINFEGTKAQWNAITKGNGWNSITGTYTIHCTDGDIAKS